jgi:transposase
VPTLTPGDIVVLDNLTSHKVAGIAEAIAGAGASVSYLPAYSPEFNPIEMVFSQLKSVLRKSAERTIPLLTQGDSMKTPHWMRRMARFLSSWKYSIARITEGRMVLQMVRTKLVSEKMLAGALSLRLVY